MRVESVAESIQMLKGILDGRTYGAIAQESGLSCLAVAQRVKALARELQTVLGVERVDADEVPTVQGLRARKENYLAALEHYHPQRAVNAGPRTACVDGPGHRPYCSGDPAAQQLQKSGTPACCWSCFPRRPSPWKSLHSK